MSGGKAEQSTWLCLAGLSHSSLEDGEALGDRKSSVGPFSMFCFDFGLRLARRPDFDGCSLVVGNGQLSIALSGGQCMYIRSSVGVVRFGVMIP